MINKIWQKLKTKAKEFFLGHDAPVKIGAFISAYYLGSGVVLTLATLSPIVFLVFTVPAIIWLMVAIVPPMLERTNEVSN